jgi:hypothetical protein
MVHAQQPEFVYRRNRRIHFNRRGRQFSRLLAAEVCASAVIMLDTPCSEVVWRVLVTHSLRQFPLYFFSRASPCAITFQLDSTCNVTLGRVRAIVVAVEKQNCTLFVLLYYVCALRNVLNIQNLSTETKQRVRLLLFWIFHCHKSEIPLSLRAKCRIFMSVYN